MAVFGCLARRRSTPCCQRVVLLFSLMRDRYPKTSMLWLTGSASSFVSLIWINALFSVGDRVALSHAPFETDARPLRQALEDLSLASLALIVPTILRRFVVFLKISLTITLNSR